MSDSESETPTPAERELLKLLEPLRAPLAAPPGRSFAVRVVGTARRQLLVRRVLEAIAAIARAAPDTALTLTRSSRRPRGEVKP